MSDTRSNSTVATPASIRWRRACTRFLPLAFFVFLCGSCLLLWGYQNRSVVQIGEVESVEYAVASLTDGVVAGWATSNGESLPIFSKIIKGQIIIELDDGRLLQNIQSIRNQLKTIGNNANAKVASMSQSDRDTYFVSTATTAAEESDDNDSEVTADSTDESKTPWERLAIYSDRAAIMTDVSQLKLDLRKTDSQIRALRMTELSAKEKAEQLLVLNQQKKEQTAKMQALRIELVSGEMVSATDLAAVDNSNFSDADLIFFQSAAQRCEVLDQQISQLDLAISQLDIRSPIAGQLEDAMVSQYDAVVAGTRVASIVPTEGKVVVVYARETGPIRPFAGMPVVLTSVTNRLLRAETIVGSVGPKIESIPTRQRANPRVEEWGRPMRIEIPESFVIEPGSLVNVTFDLNRPTR